MVVVRLVIVVLRAGRCGSALFHRESGDLTLRTLTLGRRGASSPSRTARPIRPCPLAPGMMPSAVVTVSMAVCRAMVKLARSGSVSGTDSAAVVMARRSAW